MNIIGLSGFARSGKDTVADILVEEHGYVKIAFADKLREVLYALNPVVTWTGTPPSKIWYVQDVIDTYGWDRCKETDFEPEVRRLLQRLGTEAGRETMWDTIWIDAALKRFGPQDKVVVSDARFLNELNAITQRGGENWRINRSGLEAANDHYSETEALRYNNFRFFVDNDGSLEDLRARINIIHDLSSRGLREPRHSA